MATDAVVLIAGTKSSWHANKPETLPPGPWCLREQLLVFSIQDPKLVEHLGDQSVTIGEFKDRAGCGSLAANDGSEIVPGNKRLKILALVHFALGVVTGVMAQVELSTLYEMRHILIVPQFTSALCQAFLLSLWGAVSQAKPWKRLAGLVTAAVYLEALVATKLEDEFLGIATVTIAVTTASLLVVRWLGLRLTRQEEIGQPIPSKPEGLKFSIRGLMSFTAVIALLCTVARAMQESPTHQFLLILVWAMCFVAVGLVCLWAALGVAPPVQRSPVVFVISPILGVFFAFAANAHQVGWVYVLLIMVLYPMPLFGSLLVVRSCGYRLVRSAVA
jgi:hypothetical protein